MVTMALSPEDRAEINEAIRAAETGTSAEIVCVLAAESSDYRETPLAAGAVAALLLPAIFIALGLGPWSDAQWRAAHVGAAEARAVAAAAALLAAQGVCFLAAWLIASLTEIRLALTPPSLKRLRVRQRAAEQFMTRNIHRTRERTGVLIYVSLAEHMAELMADERVSSSMPPDAWNEPMRALVEALRRGELKNGLVSAVSACGALLAAQVPAEEGANPNELPDAVAELPRL
jgi:putative membrane protein